ALPTAAKRRVRLTAYAAHRAGCLRCRREQCKRNRATRESPRPSRRAESWKVALGVVEDGTPSALQRGEESRSPCTTACGFNRLRSNACRCVSPLASQTVTECAVEINFSLTEIIRCRGEVS